jgi:hypothetical protein
MKHQLLDFNMKSMRMIPEKTTQLNLSWGSLSQKPIKTLCDVISCIPPFVKEVDFSANELDLLSTDDLVKFLQSVPLTVTEVNLSANRLGCRKSAHDIATILSALSDHVESLKLSSNHFARKSADYWKEALGALKKNITSLDLSYNHLSSSVSFVLGALNETVACLNLASNHLCDVSQTDFMCFLPNLKLNVRQLDLRNNFIGVKKSKEELLEIIKVISSKQILLDLRTNGISTLTTRYLHENISSTQCLFLTQDCDQHSLTNMPLLSNFNVFINIIAFFAATQLLIWSVFNESASNQQRSMVCGASGLIFFGLLGRATQRDNTIEIEHVNTHLMNR